MARSPTRFNPSLCRGADSPCLSLRLSGQYDDRGRWVHPTHQTLDLVRSNALLAQAQGGIDEAMSRCPIRVEFKREFRTVQGKILAEVSQYALGVDTVSTSKQCEPTH